VPSGCGRSRVHRAAQEAIALQPAEVLRQHLLTDAVDRQGDRGGLTGLVELIEAGQLKVRVEQTFPLEDAAKAHELGESGRVSGKLMLTG
jgi:NADPH:quinone reductase-like Zn-dependent oxidoreductase